MVICTPLAGEQSPMSGYGAFSSGISPVRSMYFHSLEKSAHSRQEPSYLTEGSTDTCLPRRVLQAGFPSAAAMLLKLHSHLVLSLQVHSGVRLDFPGGRLQFGIIRKC